MVTTEAVSVSVIMPVYAARKTIEAAVQSVLVQKHAILELIVVVDDAVDYSGLVPRDSRIRWLVTGSVGAGPSRARNLGLEAAAGNLISFLDSDDVWRPDKLRVLGPLALRHGVALDNSCYRHGERSLPCQTYWNDPPAGWQELAYFGRISQPLWPVFRRDSVGPVRFPEGLRFAEDAVFNMAVIARNGGAWLWPLPLHEYCVRECSLSHSGDTVLQASQAYEWILGELRSGRLLHFPETHKQAAIDIFEAREVCNQAFGASGLTEFHAFERWVRARE